MTLTIVWHKPYWSSPESPSGFASRGCLGHPGFGGLPREVEALSQFFDSTRIVGPYSKIRHPLGEIPIAGKNVSLVALTWLPRSPWLTWLVLPLWLVRNGFTLMREVARADGVFAFVPSPIGFLGLILALAFRKPLLTRQLNRWSEPRVLWRLERAFLERIAGGKNVVFATGCYDEAPSSRNPAIRWLFVTAIPERELTSIPRRSAPYPVRLILLGREVNTRETVTVLRALALLSRQFPNIELDAVGDSGTLSRINHVATELNLLDRVTLHGSASRERVVELLRNAHVFCCLPAAETEHFRQALHEALACGLPIVTTRTEIAPMLARKGCAIMLDEETPEALAAVVMACLSDSARYHTMSAAAVRTAQEYSLEQWCDRVRSVLEEAWGPLQSESRTPGYRKKRETAVGLLR
jgi:glycosyltransferase involved in cell wall biosynthesis